MLPLGKYQMPDGSTQVSFGLPQSLLDAYRTMRMGLGYEQDPQAPQGYISQNQMLKGAVGGAGAAVTGSVGANAMRALRGAPNAMLREPIHASPTIENGLIKALHVSPNEFRHFDPRYSGTALGNDGFTGSFYLSVDPKIAGPKGIVAQALPGEAGAKQVHAYNVDIDATRGRFIDMAKPLQDQPEVLQAIKSNPELVRQWPRTETGTRINGKPLDLSNPEHLAAWSAQPPRGAKQAIANLEYNLQSGSLSSRERAAIQKAIDILKSGTVPQVDLIDPTKALNAQFATIGDRDLGFSIRHQGDGELIVHDPSLLSIKSRQTVEGR